MIDLGDVLPLSVTVYDAAGNLADAGSMALTVVAPSAAYVIDPVAPTSTGIYSYDFTPLEPGRHSIRWVATGANASVFTDQFDVDAAPTGVVSLADAKGRLKITSSANDEELRRVIAASTVWLEGKVGPVVPRIVTEVVEPSSGKLLLTQAPVISLTSVVGAYGYTQTFDVSTLFTDVRAGIVRPAYGAYGFWFPVTVVYVAGIAIVDAQLQEIAHDYIEWRWESRRGASPLPLQGEEYDSTVPMDVPNKIKTALEQYSRTVVA